MLQHECHAFGSYPIDVWDAIQIIVAVPMMRGSSAYAVSYRKTMGDIFQWLEQMTEKNGVIRYEDRMVRKNQLVDDLKLKTLYHVHQVSVQPYGTTGREVEQAKVDAYSKVYDLFREEL